MSLVVRLGVIASLTAACGGESAPHVEASSPPPQHDDDNVTSDDPNDVGAVALSPIVTDLASSDAALVCKERAAFERERVLGTFSAPQGWISVSRAVGVEATLSEGGQSVSGGPLILTSTLQLAFPVPTTLDPIGPVSRMQERAYFIQWAAPDPATKPPSDLFQPGSSYELPLEDRSWVSTCSAKGSSISRVMRDYKEPVPMVTVSITSRTDSFLEGTLVRNGPAGPETLTFKAPLTPAQTDPYVSTVVCCLRDY